jgi:hypothetical protein
MEEGAARAEDGQRGGYKAGFPGNAFWEGGYNQIFEPMGIPKARYPPLDFRVFQGFRAQAGFILTIADSRGLAYRINK